LPFVEYYHKHFIKTRKIFLFAVKFKKFFSLRAIFFAIIYKNLVEVIVLKNFIENWSGHGYEKGETQKFWIELLQKFFATDASKIIFEKQVKIDGTTKFIDIYFPRTKVLVEQKSFGENLADAFIQAKNYAENLPYSERPKWIVTCNFSEFQIYNLDCMDFPEKYRATYLMNHANDFIPPTDEDVENAIRQPTKIFLKNLAADYKYLNFLIDPEVEMISPDVQISTAAAKIVQKLRDALENNFKKNSTKNYSAQIEKICTRFVFCFYATDANIFPQKISDYLKNFPDNERNFALENIFEILNTPENLRKKNLDKNLKNFPYVNGGLFAEKISLPTYNQFVENPINTALTFNAGKNFSWQTINPTIFGAMFESILNPETQRKGGMHFTSVENIHKVIDPLFLDELHEKFLKIKRKHKDKFLHLKNFHEEIAKLKFFDPACGSGNFLTETYISLRRLENKILEEMKKILGELPENPVKVSIENFFGVEIYSFAVAVAKTALWIAENQMLQETKILTAKNLYELPLKKITNIHCANALTLDWKKILPDDLNYIIGNPPFVGTKYQSAAQKADILQLCKDLKPLDYVTAWYFKAAQFMLAKIPDKKINASKNNFCEPKIQNEIISANQKFNQNNFCEPKIRAAFVSTNSIAQGEQVAPLWKILDKMVHIDFAHKTFKWTSESENMAAVHCVIIAFSAAQNDKKIFAKNINGYLQDAPNIYIEKRNFPLQDFVPKIFMGSTMVDDDNLNFSEDEMEIFLEKEPSAKKFFRPVIGSEEFIKGKKRFCLWLKDFSLEEIKKFPKTFERVEAVKNFRKKSKRAGTRKGAENPKNFLEIRQPETDFILIPKVSSENRKYIPIGFLEKNFIALNTSLIIPDANLFHFGILNSSVHNSWMRAVGGRLEMRYQYSATIIYNNFVWCEATAENVEKITATAEKILRVREKYLGWTLAQLYNTKTMPEDLRLAHLENDLAVLSAYGFDKNFSEEEIVSALMILYKNLTEKV